MLFRFSIFCAKSFSILLLAGCLETSQEGLPSGAQSKYARIALVSSVSDSVASTYWPQALTDPVSRDGRFGWNASGQTVSFVKEQLVPTGAVVTVAPAHTASVAKSSDMVLVIEQTPLNKLGQGYNPGRDFLALGGGLVAVGAVVAGEQTKSSAFKPRFVLWIRNPNVDKALIGENACTVGLTASLVDPISLKLVSDGVQVSGRSIIPGDLTASQWSQLPKAEQEKVLSYCNNALRSAVSQALIKLEVAG